MNENNCYINDNNGGLASNLETICSNGSLYKKSLFRKSLSCNNILPVANFYSTILESQNQIQINIQKNADQLPLTQNTYSTDTTSSIQADSFVIIPLEIEYIPTSPLHINHSAKMSNYENTQNGTGSQYGNFLYIYAGFRRNGVYSTLCNCTNNVCCYVWIVPLRLYNYLHRHKIQTLNYLISIFLHTCLMIIFEIYFYFNYVVVIEKQAFLEKITLYFNDLARYNHDKYSPFALSLFLNNATHTNHLLNDLYIASQQSLLAQRNLLKNLLYDACKIAATFGMVFCSLFIIGILHCRKIKWRWICAENIMMLVLLGCFEYLFFTNIIMNYNPISDAELEYLVVSNIVEYVNSNVSNHMFSHIPSQTPTYNPIVVFGNRSL